MANQDHSTSTNLASSFSIIASVVAILVGILVLIGWIFDIDFLKSVNPDRVPMMANSAIAFILSGIALGILTTTQRRFHSAAKACAALAAIIGALTFGEYVFGWNLGIDEFVFESASEIPGWVIPGRMAINSAAMFVLIGLALLVLDVRIRNQSPAQILAIFVFFASLAALYDTAYGDSRSLFGLKSYTESAIHSVLAFLVLSAGVLMARPRQGIMATLTGDGAGSVLARRLMPIAIGLPLVLSWFGWGDESTAVFGNQIATALLAVSSIFIFTFVLWWNAWSVNRTDAELKQVSENLRKLAAHLQTVREEERTHIAREIHDELGQELTVLKIGLSWLAKKIPAEMDGLAERAKSLTDLVDTTIHSVQRISSELRPGILDNLGLVAAIEWQAQEFQKRTGILCDAEVSSQPLDLEPGRSSGVFRILQEILTNVARHSGATEVIIVLTKDENGLLLEAQDNGTGITDDALSSSRSLGIIGMRERAIILGGRIDIHGRPGRGTTVAVRIPLKEEALRGSLA